MALLQRFIDENSGEMSPKFQAKCKKQQQKEFRKILSLQKKSRHSSYSMIPRLTLNKNNTGRDRGSSQSNGLTEGLGKVALKSFLQRKKEEILTHQAYFWNTHTFFHVQFLLD